MDGFVFILLVLLLLAACLLYGMKGEGKRAVYLTAVTATLLAWCVGLLLDANIDFGIDLAFRILFPILAMGVCIIKAVVKSRKD